MSGRPTDKGKEEDRNRHSDRHERTDTVRCVKSCRPNDINCVLDPVHTISNTVISLPTFREFTRPEEIIFLRAITPAYPSNHHADIIFDITEGNLRDSFDIIKRYIDGMTVECKLFTPDEDVTIIKYTRRNRLSEIWDEVVLGDF